MSKVIQFPSGRERVSFKKQVLKQKRGSYLLKIMQFIGRIFSSIFYSVRLGIATALHLSSLVVLTILDKRTFLLFFVITFGCVITYFHLGRNFTSSTNYAIPFFTCFWIFCCSTPHIIEMINQQFPFHKMFRV